MKEKLEVIPDTYETKTEYRYYIEGYLIEIHFKNKEFSHVNFPFSGKYTRMQWKILSKINKIIKDLEFDIEVNK